MSLYGFIAAGEASGMAIIVVLLLLLYGLFIHLGAKFVRADYSDYENSVAVAAASMLLAGVLSLALVGFGAGKILLTAGALMGVAASWVVIKFAFDTTVGRALLVAVFAQVVSNVAARVLIVLGAALAPLLL